MADDKGPDGNTSNVATEKKSEEGVTKTSEGVEGVVAKKTKVPQTASVRRQKAELAKVYQKRSRKKADVTKEPNNESGAQDNIESGEAVKNVSGNLEDKGNESIDGEELRGEKGDCTQEGSGKCVDGDVENREVNQITGVSENGDDNQNGSSSHAGEKDNEGAGAAGDKDNEGAGEAGEKDNEGAGEAGEKDNEGAGDAGEKGKSVENEDDHEDADDEDNEGENSAKDFLELRDDVKAILSNSKLYQSFTNHVASMLLKKNKAMDRGPLTCKQHTKKMKEWDLEKEHPSVVKLVKNSPLYCLLKCSYPTANRVLVSGFVERWHPETNTFLLSSREITITLDDVLKIIGLPITGKSLTGLFKSSDKDETLEAFVERVLGISREEVAEEFVSCNSKCVKYDFLRLKLSGKAPDTYTSEQVARGFLLHLLGCTIFQDKTGDKVQAKYLFYLEDLANINKWAWGAAALAYLYRELGKGSRLGTKTISGYLTLLEAWIYEHFPDHRPHKSIPVMPQMPRTAQWKPRTHYNAHDAKKQLQFLRIKLDGLTKKDVVWTPYRGFDESPQEVVWFTGPLMVHDISEPYQPDRVVRQFGHIQDVPKDPLAPSRTKKTGKKAMSYAPVSYGVDEFDRWEDHLLNPGNRGPRMQVHGQCTKEYDSWVKENCVIRLDYSVKDPLAHEIHNNEVDENVFKAWQILDKMYAKKNAKKDELFAAIKLAKDLIKPKDVDELEADLPEASTSKAPANKRQGKQASTTKKTSQKQAPSNKRKRNS